MKNYLIAFVLAISCYLTTTQAQALTNKDTQFLKKNGFHFVKDHAFTLQPKAEKLIKQSMKRGTYIIVVYTESGVKDIDAYLMDANGKTLTQDTDRNDNGAAFLKYDFEARQQVTIKVKNYAAYCEMCIYKTKIWVYYRSA